MALDEVDRATLERWIDGQNASHRFDLSQKSEMEGGSMTRDEQTSREIGQAQELVMQHSRTLGGIIEHATQHDATAHAAMYAEVKNDLDKAAKHLGDAYDVMQNGDPEDWA